MIRYFLNLVFNSFYNFDVVELRVKPKSSFVMVFIIMFTLIACEKDVHKTEKVETNIKLLNDEIIIDESLNISYKTPLNWDEMPASLSEKIVARLGGKNKNNLILYSPKSFYYNNNSSSLLRVGKVSLKESTNPDLLKLDSYFELFKKYNPKLIVERNDIHLKQLEIMELKIEKGNLISFKIVFNNKTKEIIQLDFSISKENLSQLKPSIDASIKSIILL